MVTALRQIRSDYNLAPARIVDAMIVADDGSRSTYDEERALIGRLARATVTMADSAPTEAAAHGLLPGGASVVVPLAGLVDLDRECAKLRTELAQLEKQLGALESRLANEGFLSRAPQDVVAAERQKAGEWAARRQQLGDKLRALCGD